MRIFVAIALLQLVASCAFFRPLSPGHEFTNKLKQIEYTLAGARPKADRIEGQAQDLFQQGFLLQKIYLQKAPECTEVLMVLKDKKEEILTIGLEELERVYHEGEGLPEAPEHCYHAKELTVHPATVIVLARQKPFLPEHIDQMRLELSELESHLYMFDEDQANPMP